MNPSEARQMESLAQRLSEAEATIQALLSGQIDAVVDSRSQTPVLLARAQDALRDERGNPVRGLGIPWTSPSAARWTTGIGRRRRWRRSDDWRRASPTISTIC
jgi:hypothetical protein